MNSWYSHKDRASSTRKQFKSFVRIELAHQQCCRASMQCAMQSNKQSMHMEDWQYVQKHIVRLPPPSFMKSLKIGNQVNMRDLRAFRSSRCTAGIDDDSSI